MWRRLFAALSLFVLSPLIAEYLLGSLPMNMIAILPIMALMYGSAAVLIREIVRRTGRGWVTLILLATAYGFLEEGLVTQSLWNPNYLHLRLLDYGYVPFLGTVRDPVVSRLSAHRVLHLQASALHRRARSACGDRARDRRATVAAFRIGKPTTPSATPAPHPLAIFVVALLCGSGFVGAEMSGKQLNWPWLAATAAMLGIVIAMLAFVIVFARGRTWSGMQRFALMAGGLGTYLWLGFLIGPELHPEDPIAAHIALAVFFVALLALAMFRARAERA
ncbi:MAG: hypothetical protein ABUS57_03165 [Pseudomonadota bacterium]